MNNIKNQLKKKPNKQKHTHEIKPIRPLYYNNFQKLLHKMFPFHSEEYHVEKETNTSYLFSFHNC